MEKPRVWILLTKGVGDCNQLLRLAEALGLPFRTIDPRYNVLHLAPPRLMGPSFASLTKRSRAEIRPPWPDLVLGVGHRSVPVALAIRAASKGRTRLVQIGNPRVDPREFDLVITTAQYSVPDAPNVLRLPVGLSTVGQVDAKAEERRWLERLPRPHRLLLIGGNTFMWRLGASRVAAAARAISAKRGGSVIAVSSARSGRRVLEAVAAALKDSDHALVWGKFPRYAALVGDADEVYVTADSASMISDAIATGKPVGLVLPQKSVLGRFLYGLRGSFGGRVPIRDVQGFWSDVQAQGFAGTVAEPVAGKLEMDPLEIALAAIRAVVQAASAR
jgi:mitochondrial fission protein ELM1